jgi:anti-sigma regulatory factor (Ser/Thr protein kinase)
MSHCFTTTLTVPRRLDAVRPAASFLVDTARSLAVPAASSSLFENAIVEALNNAIQHNPNVPDESLYCEFELDGRSLTIRVIDGTAQAPVELTAPARMPAPTAETWDQVPERGYGLYLIRAIFPDVRPVTRNGRHGIEMQLTF